MEMKVYLANLGKYNEGELIGAWFTLPIDYNDLKEKLELNPEYEEYAVHDTELPFDVDVEYVSIDELNRLYEIANELKDYPFYADLQEVQSAWFKNLDALFECKDDINYYCDCFDMEDVARAYVEDAGILQDVPSNIQNYIDYSALGRDMEIEGSYLVTSQGVYEYCR